MRSSLQSPAPRCNPERTCHRCGSIQGPPEHGISESGTERSEKTQTKWEIKRSTLAKENSSWRKWKKEKFAEMKCKIQRKL